MPRHKEARQSGRNTVSENPLPAGGTGAQHQQLSSESANGLAAGTGYSSGGASDELQQVERVARDDPSAPHAGEGNAGLNGASRQERIATAAYYNAERRGFGAGGELDDWLNAEKQIGEDA